MHFEFERSGGFAGLRVTARFDASKLPDQEAALLYQAVAEARFFHLPARIAAFSPGADRFQYRLTVRDGERAHTVRVDESAMPDSLRPLIDQLQAMARQGPASAPPPPASGGGEGRTVGARAAPVSARSLAP